MMATKYDDFENGLESDSLPDVRIPSPSILNFPPQVHEAMSDSDEEDDYVNVTMRPTRNAPRVEPSDNLKFVEEGRGENHADLEGSKKRRGLSGAARERLKKLKSPL